MLRRLAHGLAHCIDSLARYFASRAYAWRLYDEARRELDDTKRHLLNSREDARVLVTRLRAAHELLSRHSDRSPAAPRGAFITLPAGATPTDYAPFIAADFTPSPLAADALDAIAVSMLNDA